METTTFTVKEEVITLLLVHYTGLTRNTIADLINATSGTCGFVSIKNYCSDKSEHQEIANQLINIGVNYGNVLTKDAKTLENIDLSEIDCYNDKDYKYINLAGVPLTTFQYQVKQQLANALEELKAPKQAKVTNDIWITKSLVFNTTTERLSIFGSQVSKDVVVNFSEPKFVKSSPLTIAKKLINNQLNTRQNNLRRFALDNVLSTIKIQGETVEIE